MHHTWREKPRFGQPEFNELFSLSLSLSLLFSLVIIPFSTQEGEHAQTQFHIKSV